MPNALSVFVFSVISRNQLLMSKDSNHCCFDGWVPWLACIAVKHASLPLTDLISETLLTGLWLSKHTNFIILIWQTV